MTKPKCKCKTHGCAHFGSGKCRLTNFEKQCVMQSPFYHYKCCPLLNSAEGQRLLENYLKERGSK